jgi:phenylacetate-coenzyme A ligase PaaK-like adenylate-forming protein
VPVEAAVEHVALEYAALAAGAPALFPGDDPERVLAAARLAPPTVLAAPSAAAAEVVDDLASSDADLSGLRNLLLVGAPTPQERAAAEEALAAAAPDAVALAVHAPSAARVLWAECRPSQGTTGLHTYPDLEVVSTVDPETAASATGSGEVVLTQLGFRGSALLRWRTGDLAEGVDESPCPACGRRVARVVGDLRRGAMVVSVGEDVVDLRSVTGALAGRADVVDWRVAVRRRPRGRQEQLVVHVTPDADENEVAAGVIADIRAAAGVAPAQVVMATEEELEALPGEPLTPRVLLAR